MAGKLADNCRPELLKVSAMLLFLLSISTFVPFWLMFHRRFDRTDERIFLVLFLVSSLAGLWASVKGVARYPLPADIWFVWAASYNLFVLLFGIVFAIFGLKGSEGAKWEESS